MSLIDAALDAATPTEQQMLNYCMVTCSACQAAMIEIGEWNAERPARERISAHWAFLCDLHMRAIRSIVYDRELREMREKSHAMWQELQGRNEKISRGVDWCMRNQDRDDEVRPKVDALIRERDDLIERLTPIDELIKTAQMLLDIDSYTIEV